MFFGLFIWKNDNPITGNVLGLQNIVEPRKAIEEYKVGDLVSAKLLGFGVTEGIIGRIGDKSMKKEMQGVLSNDVLFYALVETVSGRRKDKEHKESQDQPPAKHSKLSDQGARKVQLEMELQEIGKGVERNKDKTVVEVTKQAKPKQTKKASQQQQMKTVTPKKAMINLEKAAEAQRQLELDLMGEQSDLQQRIAINEQDTSSVVGSAFNVLNNPDYVHQHPRLASLNQSNGAFVENPSYQTERRVADLEAYVETRLDQLWRYINAMQRDFILHIQQYHNMQGMGSQNFGSPSSSFSGVRYQTESPTNVAVTGCTGSNLTCEENVTDPTVPFINMAEPSNSPEDRTLQKSSSNLIHSGSVYNNYTKDQLWSYVDAADDFGKVAKLLFRKLYTVEETK